MRIIHHQQLNTHHPKRKKAVRPCLRTASRTLLSVCLIALFFSTNPGARLCAQASNTELNISTEVSFFSLNGTAWRGLFFASGESGAGDFTEIPFNAIERTPYRSYTGPRQFVLFVQATDAENTPKMVQLATINLNPTTRRQILLVAEGTTLISERFPHLRFDDRLSLKNMPTIDVFPDNPENFPPNSLVFFNTTSTNFYGILGSGRINVNPGINSPIDLTSYLNSDITVGLAIHDGEKHRRVLSSRFRFSPDRRTLMILRPPATEGSWRIQAQRITEFLGE